MLHKPSTPFETPYRYQALCPTASDSMSGSYGSVETPAPIHATQASLPAQQAPSALPRAQDPVVERLCTFLSGRISERVTLKELSRFLGYSEKYASDVFQRYMGHPFSKHLKQLRLDKAISMLLEERHTISTIAESVGFSDAFAFSHFFKRAIGCSPTEYRRQQLRQMDMA